MARDDSAMDTSTAGRTEQGLAAILGITALVLGAIGLLVGFGIVGTEGVDVEGVQETAAVEGSFQDGLVWLLPAIALGVLSWTLTRGEPHAAGRMGSTMHGIAYIMGLLTIVSAALALVVGFDLFDQGWGQNDGILWALASILYAGVTGALHSAVPATVTDEDYIVAVLERRGAAPAAHTSAAPATERGQ